VNNLPKVVAQRCLEQDLNPRPTDRKPKCLTVAPPCHLSMGSGWIMAVCEYSCVCVFVCSCQVSRRVASTDVRLPPRPSSTAAQFQEGDDVEVDIYSVSDQTEPSCTEVSSSSATVLLVNQALDYITHSTF